VACPVARVARDDGRQGDERRRVAGPAALDRQQPEVDLVAAQHDLLACALAHGARQRVGDGLELLQASDLLHEPGRRLHLEHVRELARNVVELLYPEREAHAPLGPELVDEQRVLRALRSLEEERRAAGLDRAVDDLRDLEIRVDLGGDSNQLTLALEQGNPLAKILHGHGASVWNRSRKEAPWAELSRRLSDARTSGLGPRPLGEAE